jgi:hypothetical protein
LALVIFLVTVIINLRNKIRLNFGIHNSAWQQRVSEKLLDWDASPRSGNAAMRTNVREPAETD